MKKQLSTVLKDHTPQEVMAELHPREIYHYFDREVDLENLGEDTLNEIIVFKRQKEQEEREKFQFDKRINVLDQSKETLRAECRRRGLISFFEYIRHMSRTHWSKHSEYGLRLVASFPQKFYVGRASTHFHYNTHAINLEEEYGIYHHGVRPNNIDDGQVRRQARDDDFIDDQEEDSERVSKKRRKIQKKEEKTAAIKRKKRNMEALNSESDEDFQEDQSEQHQENEESQEQGEEMVYEESYQSEDEEEEITIKRKRRQTVNPQRSLELVKVIHNVKAKEILKHFADQSIYNYLMQTEPEWFLDEIDEANVMLALKNVRKRNTKRGKKLKKSQINVKQLSLRQLLDYAIKQGLIAEDKLQQLDMHFQLEQHAQLGMQLVKRFPKLYVAEGVFCGEEDELINGIGEEMYQKQFRKQQLDEMMESEPLEVENSQGYNEEEGDWEEESEEDCSEQEMSDYDMDEAEDRLGVI